MNNINYQDPLSTESKIFFCYLYKFKKKFLQ